MVLERSVLVVSWVYGLAWFVYTKWQNTFTFSLDIYRLNGKSIQAIGVALNAPRYLRCIRLGWRSLTTGYYYDGHISLHRRCWSENFWMMVWYLLLISEALRPSRKTCCILAARICSHFMFKAHLQCLAVSLTAELIHMCPCLLPSNLMPLSRKHTAYEAFPSLPHTCVFPDSLFQTSQATVQAAGYHPMLQQRS